MIARWAAATGALAAVALLGVSVTPPPLTKVARQIDSQVVLQRYAVALEAVPVPKTVVFTYTVSQAGPNNIEQRHVVYRSGDHVRDETLAVDGVPLVRKIVQFQQREDRYAVARISPRSASYQMLFLHTVKDGKHDDYVYETTPLIKPDGAWVDSVTVDGTTFLPREIRFHTGSAQATGTGVVTYAPFGRFWMPTAATADARVNGKPARERIAWSDYRFPTSLPPSTFEPPKPLPQATLPPI